MVENPTEPGLADRIAKEVQISAGRDILHKNILEMGELTPFPCTEFVRILEGRLSRYHCHTGHGFTEEALLNSVLQSTNEFVCQTTRGLQEAEMLLEHMGRHARDSGDPFKAKKFMLLARQLGRRANRFHELATEHDNLSEILPGEDQEQHNI